MGKPFTILVCSLFLGGCVSSSTGGYDGRFDEYPVDDDEQVVTSDNWECTDDCSGHEAGYSWAEENGISDPDDCGGKSYSFIEGCEAYANEQTMQYEEDLLEYERDDDYMF